jgi:hypothetical protein
MFTQGIKFYQLRSEELSGIWDLEEGSSNGNERHSSHKNKPSHKEDPELEVQMEDHSSNEKKGHPKYKHG